MGVNRNYLLHFGIPGMKWGIRRYQNPDGTRTPAGKRRYKEDYHEDYKNVHDGKSVKYLSNKELQQRVTRLNNERQYNKSLKTDYVSKGQKALKTFIATAGLLSAAVAAGATYKKLGGQALDKIGNVAVRNLKVIGPYH